MLQVSHIQEAALRTRNAAQPRFHGVATSRHRRLCRPDTWANCSSSSQRLSAMASQWPFRRLPVTGVTIWKCPARSFWISHLTLRYQHVEDENGHHVIVGREGKIALCGEEARF